MQIRFSVHTGSDEAEAPSVASARRVLPEESTKAIYEILQRWESEYLESSLPFPPYDLRIRAVNNPRPITDARPLLIETARRHQPISTYCPTWDQMLIANEISEKRSRFGSVLRAPSGESTVYAHYELRWVCLCQVGIDQLLRKFSPRYKPTSLFG
jgi:hypothetical protein